MRTDSDDRDRRNRQVYLLLADRMCESYPECLKGYASVAVAPPGSIFEISLYGVSYCRQLCPDLVFSACQKVDLEKRVSVALLDSAVFKARQLRVAVPAVGNESLVDSAVGYKPVLKQCLFLCRMSFHYCPVCLVDLSFAEYLVRSEEHTSELQSRP